LFVDGLWSQTLTNLPPARSNLVTITINGQAMNYLVPQGASIASVTTSLTSLLNQAAYTNLTKVVATAHGDRIELTSIDRTKSGGQVPVAVASSPGTGAALTTFIAASRTNFLDTVAYGYRNFQVAGSATNGMVLRLTVTKTNAMQVTASVTNTSGLTLTQMSQALLDLVNTNSTLGLMGADGVTGEDLITDASPPNEVVEFNLRALSAGWNAALMQVALSGSPGFTFPEGATNLLNWNLSDLQARNHLYLTAGAASLPLTFGLNTTGLTDGYHELTAVAYEGSHIRTQKRIAQNVLVTNSALAATFTILSGASNTVLGTPLLFSVMANTNAIAKIELFGNGGSLAATSNLATAIFSVAGTNLDLGLHPFFAVVTATSGKHFRTDTKWIRLVDLQGGFVEQPFQLSASATPVAVSWPATAGRRYDILSTTNLASSFLVRDTITASNSPSVWVETNSASISRSYRVRTAN
jgi:hypothetical protein